MNGPLAAIFHYHRWATLRLVEACGSLTDEQLDSVGQGTSGSVRELLMHVVGGQRTFVLRTQGRQHEGELNRRSTWPGFEVLLAAARGAGDELVAIAEGLVEDAEVDLPHLGRVFRFPTSFFLVHAAEHTTEHLTEIRVALAQLGVDTPDLDGWSYAGAAGYGQDVTR
jgi:uncharacterized damage-inducible protein DinB